MGELVPGENLLLSPVPFIKFKLNFLAAAFVKKKERFGKSNHRSFMSCLVWSLNATLLKVNTEDCWDKISPKSGTRSLSRLNHRKQHLFVIRPHSWTTKESYTHQFSFLFRAVALTYVLLSLWKATPSSCTVTSSLTLGLYFQNSLIEKSHVNWINSEASCSALGFSWGVTNTAQL